MKKKQKKKEDIFAKNPLTFQRIVLVLETDKNSPERLGKYGWKQCRKGRRD